VTRLLAVEWGTGQVFLSLLWLALFVIWIWLVLAVFVDLFGRPDVSGWAKVLWVVLVVVVPILGVLVYVVTRTDEMRVSTGGLGFPSTGPPPVPRSELVLSPDTVDALARLAAERDAGAITADEYVTRRARLLA
jgi:hypothetical protein